jgi:hypothetical protein
MSVRYLYLIAATAAFGCAPAVRPPAIVRTPNILTAREIATIDVSTAYDAIERLRPLFLRSRGKTSLSNIRNQQYATVFINGVRNGDISTLRDFPANTVLEVRYYTVAEGAAIFGLQTVGGVINVILK